MGGYSKANMSPASDVQGPDSMMAPDARGSHLGPDKCGYSQMMPPGLDSSGGVQENLAPGDRQPNNFSD